MYACRQAAKQPSICSEGRAREGKHGRTSKQAGRARRLMDARREGDTKQNQRNAEVDGRMRGGRGGRGGQAQAPRLALGWRAKWKTTGHVLSRGAVISARATMAEGHGATVSKGAMISRFARRASCEQSDGTSFTHFTLL